MKTKLVAVLALGALAATPALARQPLTRDAAKARADLLFGIADINHDGIITRAEFDAYLKATNGDPAKANAMFEELDSEHRGQVTKAQVEADALAKFDRADLNHDGRIDDSEIAARRLARQAAAAAASAPAPSAIIGNGDGALPAAAPMENAQ